MKKVRRDLLTLNILFFAKLLALNIVSQKKKKKKKLTLNIIFFAKLLTLNIGITDYVFVIVKAERITRSRSTMHN